MTQSRHTSPKPLVSDKPPPCPPPPPNRSFYTNMLGGETETSESLELSRDYQNFMRGYYFALNMEPPK